MAIPISSVSINTNTYQAKNAHGQVQPHSEEAKAETASQKNDKTEYTEEDKKKLAYLKQRDNEVRVHEQAHIAAGGQYITSGASFTYETGPDGKRYAIGGEVSIDVSEVPGNPEETVSKMRVVKKAALAPASPSSADISIASNASMKEMEAMAEVREESFKEQSETGKNETNNKASAYQEIQDGHQPSAFNAIA